MVEALKIMWRRVMHVVSFAPCPIVSITGIHMPETCYRYDTVTAAGADASCIYLESFSFSLLCTIEYTHTVLPFHVVVENLASVVCKWKVYELRSQSPP
jgi:hypothetical protein